MKRSTKGWKWTLHVINPERWAVWMSHIWLMLLMRLLTALLRQGHNQMTSPSSRRRTRLWTQMHDKKRSSTRLLQQSVSLHAGWEVRGYNSLRVAPLQTAWRLTAESPLPWRYYTEGDRGEKGQKALEVIQSFPVRSDVSLRLNRCCSSSGCCGQMLLRTHKRDGLPLTGWGKTQVNFSGFLWRLGVLGRW